MKYLFILLFCFVGHSQVILNNPYITHADTFPPAGQLVTNGEPNGSTGWETPLNGSTFSTGYATVEGGTTSTGSIGNSAANWSLRQNSIFAIDGVKTYSCGVEARTIDGETGTFQMTRGYLDASGLETTVTASWVLYEFTLPASTETWADDLTMGIENSDGSVEVRNIYVIEN